MPLRIEDVVESKLICHPKLLAPFTFHGRHI
jgi:hypothetical protein